MKHIVFLLGSPDISGGTNVIFEHATRLGRMGFEVTILTEAAVDPKQYAWHPNANELEWAVIDEVANVEFDFVIATWWQSVRHLEAVSGKYYIYFIQSIESRFFAKRDPDAFFLRDVDIIAEWCGSTYRYPLLAITEARWIQEYLSTHFNRPSNLVLNGIRKDIFNDDTQGIAATTPGRLRVLVEGPIGVFYKNVEKTIELCLRAGVPEIWLLTSSDISEFPGVDRCFSRVPIAETAEIYASCDVLVKLSYVEGMFGPPLEMFHCGGTCVVYDVTGHDEYIQDGVNGIVVKRDEEDQVVTWLQKLQGQDSLLNKLKEGARKTAEDWPDWQSAAARFAETLRSIEETPPSGGRTFITEHNEFFEKVRDNGIRTREIERFAERERSIADGSSGFSNYIQGYFDQGDGLSDEIVVEYSCGQWQRCELTLPVTKSPVTLRLDPSVRVGIVAIRKLVVSDAETGKCLQSYVKTADWNKVHFEGSLICLKREPYPVLEAIGEDPQMILPAIEELPGGDGLKICVEVCEMSFSQALSKFESFETDVVSLKKKISNSFYSLFRRRGGII